ATAAIAAASFGAVILGNVALYRHDVHFDVTRTARFTAPPELETIAAGLRNDVSLTYFYNGADEYARASTETLVALARHRPHLRVSAVDLDKDPAAGRRYTVRSYNTAIVETEGRRVRVENTVDLRQMAFAILRATKQGAPTICFVTGHGEPFERRPSHLHFSHVETLQGHETPGAGDVIEGAPDGIDRLLLALEVVGYAARAVAPATLRAIPDDCAAVADIGPRLALAPNEPAVLAGYLAHGGRMLMMIDPGFPVGAELRTLLAGAGMAVGGGVVVDPTDHYGTEEEKIAVPYYPPHPITDRIAMTVIPETRPIRLSAPPEGVSLVPLFISSKDSYLRPLDTGSHMPSMRIDAAADSERRSEILAAAAQGRWPDAASDGRRPFRLVVAGSSAFAANAFFPLVSNGELALSMLRWLADDGETAPVKPPTYSLPQIVLTKRQMQGIFLVIEVLLPLSVVLAGMIVWWTRQ
ncbi:MAG TPA: Gldg family protein, partial [Stellaceae bacterium]